MAVPIRYNIRNLRLRKGATVMTALGIVKPEVNLQTFIKLNPIFKSMEINALVFYAFP